MIISEWRIGSGFRPLDNIDKADMGFPSHVADERKVENHDQPDHHFRRGDAQIEITWL